MHNYLEKDSLDWTILHDISYHLPFRISLLSLHFLLLCAEIFYHFSFFDNLRPDAVDYLFYFPCATADFEG